MAKPTVLNAVPVGEGALSMDELAHACGVAPDWIVRHVEAGVFQGALQVELDEWRFSGADLVRARRILQVEQAFDANEDVAALVVDLGEELRRLKARLP